MTFNKKKNDNLKPPKSIAMHYLVIENSEYFESFIIK